MIFIEMIVFSNKLLKIYKVILLALEQGLDFLDSLYMDSLWRLVATCRLTR